MSDLSRPMTSTQAVANNRTVPVQQPIQSAVQAPVERMPTAEETARLQKEADAAFKAYSKQLGDKAGDVNTQIKAYNDFLKSKGVKQGMLKTPYERDLDVNFKPVAKATVPTSNQPKGNLDQAATDFKNWKATGEVYTMPIDNLINQWKGITGGRPIDLLDKKNRTPAEEKELRDIMFTDIQYNATNRARVMDDEARQAQRVLNSGNAGATTMSSQQSYQPQVNVAKKDAPVLNGGATESNVKSVVLDQAKPASSDATAKAELVTEALKSGDENLIWDILDLIGAGLKSSAGNESTTRAMRAMEEGRALEGKSKMTQEEKLIQQELNAEEFARQKELQQQLADLQLRNQNAKFGGKQPNFTELGANLAQGK